MRVVLDTNAYSVFMRGDQAVGHVIQKATTVALPFVVIAELRAGFEYGSRTAENEQQLIRFLNRARVEVLYPDDATTHHYARLFAQLQRTGKPIPSSDLWIASLVLQHGMTLCSRDRHFDNLPQLPRV